MSGSSFVKEPGIGKCTKPHPLQTSAGWVPEDEFETSEQPGQQPQHGRIDVV